MIHNAARRRAQGAAVGSSARIPPQVTLAGPTAHWFTRLFQHTPFFLSHELNIDPVRTKTARQHGRAGKDFLKARYPEPAPRAGRTSKRRPPVGVAADEKKEEFRQYEAEARPSVREFYRLNHTHQTYDFVQAKRKEYLGLNRMCR
jgi:hypothetical protein